jgi:ribonuclease HII
MTRTRTRPVDRPPGIRHERPHWEAGLLVGGVDEVGRGAWAGPVSVGVVVLSPDRRIHRLRDSKLLAPAERERIAVRIARAALGVAVGHASNREIDRLGMTAALRLATTRALDRLAVRPDVLLVDGNLDFASGHGTRNHTVVAGDRHSASIAAASIVAKVTRDGMLVDWDEAHPAYRFAANKGYPSPDHREALAAHGPCILHRHSWAPIAQLAQGRLFD